MTPKPQIATPLRAELDPGWCAQCGDYGALASLEKSLAKLGLAEERIAIVGGPGCAGKLPRGLRGYRLEVPAGAVANAAFGLQAARPDVRVVAVAGETDAFAAGLGSLISLARLDPNFVLVVLANERAAASAGDPAPDVVRAALPVLVAAGLAFLGRALVADAAGSEALFARAFEHRGMSLVVLESVCPTFHPERDDAALRTHARSLPPAHDATDRRAAMAALEDAATLWTGVLLERRRPAPAKNGRKG